MKQISLLPALLGLLLPLLWAPPARAQDTAFAFPLVQAAPGLTLHKEMFLLPLSASGLYHGRETEVVFKLSAKQRIFKSRFYFAYTQISFWQAYDTGNSSPFRETNYNPEVFYRFGEKTRGSGWSGADAGFEHESNGQVVPLSRSWNLLYLAPYYRGHQWLAYVKLRYRIPEAAKESPDSALGDDNPGITDYLGWTDINFYYHFPKNHLVHLLVRGFIGTDKGLVDLSWSFPVPRVDKTCFLVRLSSGYGESLADYNKWNNRLGLGVLFNR